MILVPLTRESVRTALDRIVAEVGEDFRYSDQYGNNCTYVVDGRPACLWGRILFRHGYDAEKLAEWEGESIHTILTELGNDDYAFGTAAIVLQSDQDDDHTWGYCRTMFTANLRNIDEEVTAITDGP